VYSVDCDPDVVVIVVFTVVLVGFVIEVVLEVRVLLVS
jgi:hypothetical protein